MPQGQQVRNRTQQPGGGAAGLNGARSAGANGMAAGSPSTKVTELFATIGNKLLKKGAKGEAVEALQQLLNQAGARLEVDGDYGMATYRAVADFQRDRDLQVDGEVGRHTRTALKSALSGGRGGDRRRPGGGGRQSQQPGGERGGERPPQGGERSGQRQPGGANQGKDPRWLGIARSEVGVKEIPGRRHNPRVIEYHATTGKFNSDEVAWCSSFVNWVMEKAGYRGTGSALALSWKKWGKKLSKPAYGSIVVFSWGGGKGHVGFIVGKSGSTLQVLGGNQSNQVKVTSFGSGSVTAYVVPADYQVPDSAYDLTASGRADPGGVNSTR
ncbi:MAG: TIGR02594 family protein [Deltaproteobacteria bacterium]|nr:TIGR02594 family protein [Deltaproteobacteria bacterium]